MWINNVKIEFIHRAVNIKNRGIIVFLGKINLNGIQN